MGHRLWRNVLLFIPSPLATGAIAQTPVAIVEEVESKAAGLEFMDYLAPGRTVHLAPGERLVVGYLKSCWRETITGGIVTIGTEQSVVREGHVQRSKAPCDVAEGTTAKETAASGAMVFRNLKQQIPRHTVYALSPVFAIQGDGSLLIERLDQREEVISVETAAQAADSFVDLARKNIELVAGGLYRAKHGHQEVVFKVDSSANSRASSVIGRLVHLRPPS